MQAMQANRRDYVLDFHMIFKCSYSCSTSNQNPADACRDRKDLAIADSCGNAVVNPI